MKNAFKNFNLFLELLLLLLLAFLFTNNFPILLRITSITIIFLYFIFISFQKYSFKKLGLVKIQKSDWIYNAFSLLLFFLIVIYKQKFRFFCPAKPMLVSNNLPVIIAFFSYSFVSVPAQELVFRSYLINRLEDFKLNIYLQVLLSAFVFSWIHLVWGLKIIVLTFIQGLFFAYWFKKNKNILSLILIHIILGSAFGLVCFLKNDFFNLFHFLGFLA